MFLIRPLTLDTPLLGGRAINFRHVKRLAAGDRGAHQMGVYVYDDMIVESVVVSC